MSDPAGSDPWRGMPAASRIPHPDRGLVERGQFEVVMAAHDAAVERGDKGYLDPVTGLFVMTAVTHWDRGTCCLSGCRHCPYAARPTAADPADR